MGHSTETTAPTEPEVGDADEGEAGEVAQPIRTTGAKLFGNKTAYQRLHTERDREVQSICRSYPDSPVGIVDHASREITL